MGSGYPPTYPGNNLGGYNCPSCGGYIALGEFHHCQGGIANQAGQGITYSQANEILTMLRQLQADMAELMARIHG